MFMEQKKMMAKIIVAAILFVMGNSLQAQQSRVDSVIHLLNKSSTPNGLDTITFNNARQLIRTAILSDAQISQIEKATDQFRKGTDEDICYVIKYEILKSLGNSDKISAIEYGKLNYQKAESSRTPRSKYLAKAFLIQLRLPYRNSDKLPEGFKFITEQLNKYKKANDSLGLLSCYYILGGFYRTTGLYEPAIYNTKKSVSYSDTNQMTTPYYFGLTVKQGKYAWIDNAALLSEFYIQMEDYEKAFKNSKEVLQRAFEYYKAGGNDSQIANGRTLLFTARHLVWAKILTNQLDSVDYYLQLVESANYNDPEKSFDVFKMQLRAMYDIKIGAFKQADSLLQLCMKLVDEFQIGVNQPAGFIVPDYFMALLRIEEKKYGEAIEFLHKDIERARLIRSNVLRDYELLADLYEKTGDDAKAKQAYKSFINLQDSILADQSKYRTISFETEQQITDNEIAISKLESESKLSAQSRNFTIGIAALLLILAGSIYYRFKSKQKANQVLQEQKEKIEITLQELKSTQSQLIQSEKMASLGELTAGIAHEIQNPLNFVNNFSEVSKELISELSEEVDRGNYDEVKAIASDVVENLDKINHHGKRAADIVKGMLQHSRSSSGQKEPTDINALADEYLRLAYHARLNAGDGQGLRAKDKDFNATIIADFDESIGNINIIPQDIGRVILNLINNAFYAVSAKASASADSGYEPTVSVITKKEDNKVFISVKDNGNGIPQKILDKIFQPFFTTKPTGQGTGLGLSLSYDILKAHGGELKVETKEAVGSEFVIVLPVNQ
jgi:signal transduction histidine kinase